MMPDDAAGTYVMSSYARSQTTLKGSLGVCKDNGEGVEQQRPKSGETQQLLHSADGTMVENAQGPLKPDEPCIGGEIRGGTVAETLVERLNSNCCNPQ